MGLEVRKVGQIDERPEEISQRGEEGTSLIVLQRQIGYNHNICRQPRIKPDERLRFPKILTDWFSEWDLTRLNVQLGAQKLTIQDKRGKDQ